MSDEENDVAQDLAEAIAEVRPDEEPEEETLEGAEQDQQEEQPVDDTEADETPEDEVPAEPEPEEDPVELTAPEDFPEDHKKAFESLPEEGKKVLLDTHRNLVAGYNDKYKGIADQRKEIEALDTIFQPIEAQLRAANADRVTAIRYLVDAQQRLNSDPVGGITFLIDDLGGSRAKELVARIVEHYGVTEAADSQADEFEDPKVTSLETRLNDLERKNQEYHQLTQAQRQQAAEDSISAFASEKDDGGNLIHPHFEKVQKTMGVLISGGSAPDMQTAYDMAVHADPDIRNELIDLRVADATAKASAARKNNVQSAKRASRNVKSDRTPQVEDVDEDSSVEDILKSEIRKATGTI